MAWKEKMSFIAPQATPHRVQGQEFNFYPVSLATMFKLRGAAKSIAKALATIFNGNASDNGSVHRQIANEHKSFDTETVVEAVAADVIKLRHEQRVEAFQNVVETLMDEANLVVLGELIIDSLRDVFPKEARSEWPPAKEFITATEGPALVDMIVGVAKANKGLFGPLVGKAGATWSKVAKVMESKLAETLNETDGETSRTKSSGSSNEATLPPKS